jgi:hypothetical protein
MEGRLERRIEEIETISLPIAQTPWFVSDKRPTWRPDSHPPEIALRIAAMQK